MGACFSPPLANLYMGWWEEGRLYAADCPFQNSLFWYGRYIDNLLIIWRAGRDLLTDFLTYLNDNPDNLTFIMDYIHVFIHFLDIWLYSRNGQFFTLLYRKPTSGNGILRAESCHPDHAIRNLPIGEYVRDRRTCTSQDDYDKEVQIIDNRLWQRGYSRKLLHSVFWF